MVFKRGLVDWYRVSSIFCVILIASITPAFANLSAKAEDPSAKVDRLFRGMGFSAQTPGCSVSVSHSGKLVFGRGYGMENLEAPVPKRIDLNSRLRLNSLTKPIMALAIMIARERFAWLQDRDLLEYTLGDFFAEEFKSLSVEVKRITVRDLLQHSSGLASELEPELAEPFAKAHGFSFGSHHIINESLVPLYLNLHPPQLKFITGQAFYYSNLSYWLLAEILSKVSGLAWQGFLKEAIFDPASMHDTIIDSTEKLIRQGLILPSYDRPDGKTFSRFEVEKGWIWREGVLASGGIHSTAFDLHRFHHAIDSGEWLSPAGWETLFTARQLPKFDEKAGSITTELSHYSLGWSVKPDHFTLPLEPYITYVQDHTGGGHGYYTYMGRMHRLFPHCRNTVVILCNENGHLLKEIRKVAAEIFSFY